VSSTASTRAEVCAVACAELFRDAGEIMVSPMANMVSVGARLARLTFQAAGLTLDLSKQPWSAAGQAAAVELAGRANLEAAACNRSGSIAPPSNSTYRCPATPPSRWLSWRPTHSACWIGASGNGSCGASADRGSGVSGSRAAATSDETNISFDQAPIVGAAASVAKSTATPRRRQRPASVIIRIESRP